MSGQGYHLALDHEQSNQLLSCIDESDTLDRASQILEVMWKEKVASRSTGPLAPQAPDRPDRLLRWVTSRAIASDSPPTRPSARNRVVIRCDVLQSMKNCKIGLIFGLRLGTMIYMPNQFPGRAMRS